MAILRQGTFVGALGIIVAGSGCGRDLFLSTSNLEIGPNPAQPGDMVVASFVLTLVPTQPHTITVYIDDTEHLRVTSNEAPPVPLLVQLGEAADLIAAYGTGVHAAYIEVHVSEENQTTRTQSASFELQDAAP